MTRAVMLQAATITIGLTPQPQILQSLASCAAFRGRGFLARFLYSIPKSPLGRRHGKADSIPASVLEDYRTSVRMMLDKFQPHLDLTGSIGTHVLTLSAAAYNLWFQFWLEVESDFRDRGQLEFLKDWGSKLPGAVARIAAILHTAEHAFSAPQSTLIGQKWNTVISEEIMQDAISLARTLVPHARFAFDQMGVDQDMAGAKLILEWIQRQDIRQFSQREGHHALQHRFPKVSKLEAALGVLEERGYIRRSKAPETRHKPSKYFDVNPHFFEKEVNTTFV
jgi:hypothetical protein